MNWFGRSWRLVLALLLVEAGEGAGVHAIFRSTDGGRSWVRTDMGDVRVNAFGAVAKTVLAGTDAGIYGSGDDGRSWRQVEGVTRRIVALATVGGRVFAATDREGLLVSADEGKSWQSLSLPVKRLRSLLADRGRLLVGTEGEGVFVSGDEGRNWTKMAAGLPAQAQIFALGAVGDRVFAGLYAKGLYSWEESGGRWVKVEGVSPLALAATGSTLVAGHTRGGLFGRDDGGKSWGLGTGEVAGEAPVWVLGAEGGRVVGGG